MSRPSPEDERTRAKRQTENFLLSQRRLGNLRVWRASISGTMNNIVIVSWLAGCSQLMYPRLSYTIACRLRSLCPSLPWEI